MLRKGTAGYSALNETYISLGQGSENIMEEEMKRMKASNHGEEDHEMLSMSMIWP